MRLLLDENLSRRLLPALQAAFPGSSHVVLGGLASADDETVWQHAKHHGFVIVSKDDDSAGLMALRGHPPKLAKISLGNCTNDQVLDALVQQSAAIVAALEDAATGSVELIAG